MQHISFETTIKNGCIKIPERYSNLNDKKVVVDILDKDITAEEKEERLKNTKEFIRKCSGILKNTNIPPDITIKEIKEMRLKEKIDLIITRNKKDFANEWIEVQTPEEYLASISPGKPLD